MVLHEAGKDASEPARKGICLSQEETKGRRQKLMKKWGQGRQEGKRLREPGVLPRSFLCNERQPPAKSRVGLGRTEEQ